MNCAILTVKRPTASFLCAISASTVLWTSSCSLTTSPSTTTTSEGQKSQAPAGMKAARADKALVRFINADPSGSTDVWMDGMRLFANTAYKTITPYQEVLAHVGEFRLRESGGTKELAANHREMFQGRHYTLIALPEQNHSSRLASISDDLGWVEPGEAGVRLINATTDVDDLDLYLEGSNKRIGHAVDPGMANSITEVLPGTLEIRRPGNPAFEGLANLKVEENRVYTFIVDGTTGYLELMRVEDRIVR